MSKEQEQRLRDLMDKMTAEQLEELERYAEELKAGQE